VLGSPDPDHFVEMHWTLEMTPALATGPTGCGRWMVSSR
jgi:hypothetical protein